MLPGTWMESRPVMSSIPLAVYTVLLKVKAAGPACHTGAESCFFNEP